MREIKFRGKNDKNKWVMGSLIVDELQDYYICWTFPNPQNYINCGYDQVNPKTTGQYTGYRDCNQKEIWEGDIVKFYRIREDGFSVAGGYYKSNSREEFRGVISFIDGAFQITQYECYPFESLLSKWLFHSKHNGIANELRVGVDRIDGYINASYINLEVIGNIHDNPELLFKRR